MLRVLPLEIQARVFGPEGHERHCGTTLAGVVTSRTQVKLLQSEIVAGARD